MQPHFRTASMITLGLVWATLSASEPARAEDLPGANDNLNAVLWDQTAIEAKANALGAYALARIRLDEALADPAWTAAPSEQTGDFKNLPPAVVLDVDDTVLNTSKYQAWNVKAGTSFTPQTWTQYVKAQVDAAIPGSVEFTQYAASKGVKVFYVSNRTAEEEAGTRKNLERLGFPMGGNVDTFLMARKKPDWGSAKGTRRAFVAKDYRVLLMLGDNFGDFVDSYRGSEAERLKVYEDNKARWGREWIMLANPAYGSFESAPFGHDYKKSADEQRKAKRDVLDPWKGPN